MFSLGCEGTIRPLPGSALDGQSIEGGVLQSHRLEHDDTRSLADSWERALHILDACDRFLRLSKMKLPASEALSAIGPIIGSTNQADPVYAKSVVLGLQDPSLMEAGAKSIVNSSVCPEESSSDGARTSQAPITDGDLKRIREWIASSLPHEVRPRVYPLLFVCWSAVDIGGAAGALREIEIDSERLSATLPLVFLLHEAYHEHERDPLSNEAPPIEAVETVHEGLPEMLKEMDLLGAHILYSHYREIDLQKAERYREESKLYLQKEQQAQLLRESALE